MAARLRVYRAPEEARPRIKATVRIRLEDMLPLVALAQKNDFVWLQDFLDDEVTISDDLYEVLQAFRSYRPSA
jgi:hypothetical protein